MEALPLSRLLRRARRALALNFPQPLWVRAEVAEVSERRGHRYLQLVEKGEAERAEARIQALVWSRDYRAVLRQRGAAAAEVLAAGQEVVLRVEVDLHEVYGLKLVVLDWDPAFTLGRLELRRREIVDALRRRRLLRRNAALPLPPVVQRVAVLSSARAAGYADFVAQLAANPHGYRIQTHLYDVSVQGAGVASDVAAAFRRIAERPDAFDAVVVLRGGGSRLDLAGFDDAGVGEAIARSPLPVLVGIGHETDETLPDLVAHTSLKTPTALADFLLERAARFEADLLAVAREIARRSERRRARAAEQLAYLESDVRGAARRRLRRTRGDLDDAGERLGTATHLQLARRRTELDAHARHLSALDPMAVLARGFAIVTRDGTSVRRAGDLLSGDRILTHFADDAVESVVA